MPAPETDIGEEPRLRCLRFSRIKVQVDRFSSSLCEFAQSVSVPCCIGFSGARRNAMSTDNFSRASSAALESISQFVSVVIQFEQITITSLPLPQQL